MNFHILLHMGPVSGSKGSGTEGRGGKISCSKRGGSLEMPLIAEELRQQRN